MGKRWRRVARAKDKKLARWAAWATIVAVPLAIVSLLITAIPGGSSDQSGRAADDGTVLVGTDNPAKQVHFTVSTTQEVGAQWIVPHPVGSPPPPGSCTDLELNRRVRWFVHNGGVIQGLMRIRVDVVNDSPDTLVLNGVSLHSYSRGPRTLGRSYVACAPIGGSIDFEKIEMNLFTRPPTFSFQDANYDPIPTFAFAPTKGRPEVFYVEASTLDQGRTNHATYRWSLALSYTLGGKSGTFVIDGHGRPFVLTD
jgi:hypothetical protein